MARQQAATLENKAVRGLITESTALTFPEGACTETYNCIFDETGRITRRGNFDIESNFDTDVYTPEEGEAWTSFVWRNVAGTANVTFYVQQQGSSLRFYDITDTTSVSVNQHPTVVDLNDYLPPSSTENPATEAIQYTQGRGDLVCTSIRINPIMIRYDTGNDQFTVTELSLKYRDFEGVDDGLDIDERPTASVSGIKTSNPQHYYNLINQGWYGGGALADWDTARPDLPSNSDYIGYTRASDSDAFDSAYVTQGTVGNGPAPKGHFVLNVGESDRTAALLDGGFTGAVIPGGSTAILGSTGSEIGNFTNSTQAFDGDTTEFQDEVTAETNQDIGWIGKNYSSVTGRKVGRAVVYSLKNAHLFDNFDDPVTIRLYGKATAPANSTDGTLLGEITEDSTVGKVYTIPSNDVDTVWNYVWVRMTGGTEILRVAEVKFFTPGNTFNRPRCCCFYAGRVFYAGVDSQEESSYVYFTQIIREDSQYEKCFQANDPTSEEIADLLPNDGGQIRIPEIGQVVRLFQFQSQLLVFATNGVWLIAGSNGGFTATDFFVRRISSIGMFSPDSVVDVKGLPMWWAEDGIYTVSYDANYNSTTVNSATEDTIKTFITDIPPINRQYVKGCYDRVNSVAYWVYNDTPELGAANYYVYDAVLCLNAKSGAFYPWTVNASVGHPQKIRGVAYVQDGNRTSPFMVKYPITFEGLLSFADSDNTDYVDWLDYGDGDADDDLEYSSYFIGGFRLDANAIKFFQANYIMVYLDTLEDSSAFVQGIYDFTNGDGSGKWSTPQQVYDTFTTLGRTYRGVRQRRLKLRGKGRALQVKIYSETNKPFSIIGWGLVESSNASI